MSTVIDAGNEVEPDGDYDNPVDYPDILIPISSDQLAIYKRVRRKVDAEIEGEMSKKMEAVNAKLPKYFKKLGMDVPDVLLD